jgi:polyisoprenoid-binding protein YceI
MVARTLLISAFCAASLVAAETVVELDPARTKVEWVLGAALHTVKGTFRLKSGAVRFDPATGKATGEIVIDAASGESGSGARDSRMHKNVLESARYPEIAFAPDLVTGTAASGNAQVQAHGSLTIHGASHEITIPVKATMGAGEATFDASFAVPYVAWGMKNPSTLFLRVHDKVDITIHGEAKIKQ